MSLIFPVVNTEPGRGYPPSREFGAVMMESIWVIWHVTGALGVAAGLAGAWRWLPMRPTSRIGMSQMSALAAHAFCACALAWLCYQTVLAAWHVAERNENNSAAVELGEFARAHLPENAVFFCQASRGNEHFMAMFYTDRTCYPLQLKRLDETARQVEAAGGVPYIVCVQRLSYPSVYVGRHSRFTVWQWQP
jgi:hypothetical protein